MDGSKRWSRPLLVAGACVLIGCGDSDPGDSGPVTLASIGLTDVSPIALGATAESLEAAFPAIIVDGYGYYRHSVGDFTIGYSFDGFAPNEGARVPPNSRLESIRVTPTDTHRGPDAFLSTVRRALGPPEECYSQRLGVRVEGTHWYWSSPTVLIADRTVLAGRPGEENRPRIREVFLQLGGDPLASDSPREPIGC